MNIVGMETIPTPIFYSYLTVESGSSSNLTFETNLFVSLSMDSNFDREKVKVLLEEVTASSSAEFTEAIFSFRRSGTTRFSDNCITQNVVGREASVSVRVVHRGRVGRASSNRMDESALKELPIIALNAAEVQGEPDPDLPEPVGPAEYREVEAFSHATAEFSPEQRAAVIAKAASACKVEGLQAAGIFATGESALAVANSKGVFAYHRDTSAEFSLTAGGDGVFGWSEGISHDVNRIDTGKIVKTAMRKAVTGRNRREIEPGEYTVILEPAAVVDFLFFLSFQAFGALNYLEGRSFLSGKMGQPVFGANVTIFDDAFHPLIKGLPFDYEGVPRRTVRLINKGVAESVVWDSASAKRGGTVSTGHALPQPNSTGPIPLYLRMEGGDSSLEEMISTTDRGILVTHFHYTNVLDPIVMELTGMTRDGTFMIEGGEIAYPIKNMRFTQSLVEALNRVTALSKVEEPHRPFFGGAMAAPALKIEGFNFSSVTEF